MKKKTVDDAMLPSTKNVVFILLKKGHTHLGLPIH